MAKDHLKHHLLFNFKRVFFFFLNVAPSTHRKITQQTDVVDNLLLVSS